MAKGDTTYSDEIAGVRGNFNWTTTFDLTDGFVGITQKEADGTVKDRVLLSPNQARELAAFVKARS